ncbi:cilia- and flagella-associated protein 251 [Nephila pilipes]|uniref:Cilia- and flagella-associated protein 251 n=1 Tax=Nephila pilipes TaxID=299642 RepID=A0A8X6NS76_NEPPI|nr:cilia- and flagella-associated protein 251 [Nephila pilipes]
MEETMNIINSCGSDNLSNEVDELFPFVNNIISIAATSNKTYLASVDNGTDGSLIVWHAKTGKIVFFVHGCFLDGVEWMCFSGDDNVLLTLSGGIQQILSLWNWKKKEMSPFCTYSFDEKSSFQHFVSFHAKDSAHFISCSRKDVTFLKLDGGRIISSVLSLDSLYDEKACKQAGDFTQTIFSPVSSLAITGTSKGKVILWGRPLYSKEKTTQSIKSALTIDPMQRICLRMMQAFTSHCSITYLGTCENLIVVGTSESTVCFFNELFQLIWSIKVPGNEVAAVSFNFKPKFSFKQAVLKACGRKLRKESPFERNDFIVCTNDGYAGYIKISSSEITDVLKGTAYSIKNVAVHPSKPYIYFGDYNGGLQKWNYDTKVLMNKDVLQESCNIEALSIDSNGSYVACAMLDGKIAIFDAASFSAKACFTADTGHRLTMIKFSPDPQHLIVTDEVAHVSRFQLHLIVASEVYQAISKDKVPPEEPVWYFNGKSHQHRGKIIDCMFNNPSKSENLYFYTLGEDRIIIQYNITNSRSMEIEVSLRMTLDNVQVPICMCWYPLYDLDTTIAVINVDGKLYVYNLEDEVMIKMISLPLYEEPMKRIVLLEHPLYVKGSINQSEDVNLKKCYIFSTSNLIGLCKYPIDGNPNASLAVAAHPKGINNFVTNQEQTFLFTAGKTDSWIYEYEINLMALLKAEESGGKDLDVFKSFFPKYEDPEEMKRRLIYSVYSLESEMKMLQLGENEELVLKGEIPINYLEYVMSALGCFLSSEELQLMLNDINFENKYLHDGKKSTLNCLDIIKLYVNYYPKDPLTKELISHAFKEILLSEEDPDKISKGRFLDILQSSGDPLPENELISIIRCLKDTKYALPSSDEKYFDENSSDLTKSEDVKEDESIIPKIITEETFFRDILCMEESKEDLSSYVLKTEDMELRQDHPKLDDFLHAIQESNMWEDFDDILHSF